MSEGRASVADGSCAGATGPGANATGRTFGVRTPRLVDQTSKNVLDVSATLVETLFVVSVSTMFV
jgi:hypothetical protein